MSVPRQVLGVGQFQRNRKGTILVRSRDGFCMNNFKSATFAVHVRAELINNRLALPHPASLADRFLQVETK